MSFLGFGKKKRALVSPQKEVQRASIAPYDASPPDVQDVPKRLETSEDWANAKSCQRLTVAEWAALCSGFALPTADAADKKDTPWNRELVFIKRSIQSGAFSVAGCPDTSKVSRFTMVTRDEVLALYIATKKRPPVLFDAVEPS